MRDLLLLQGVPGSGKSTFIESNKLEAYTICPDKIRLLFQSPIFDPKTGKKGISQKNDKRVWQFVNERVEEKMQRGEFIVIDATNISVESWCELAKTHNYTVWVKRFDISIKEALRRNDEREEYKRVPSSVVINMYERLQRTTTPKSVRQINSIDDIFRIVPTDINEYNQVVLFGDIHGCYDPIKKWFNNNPFDKSNLYIFVGDYLDRGVQNKETLEFFIGIMDSPNVVFLEGNHNWESLYADDKVDEIKSQEFLLGTLPQIKDVDKKLISQWCEKWRDMFYFVFNEKEYFITHAGMGFFPKNLRDVPSRDMIRGGFYSDDVDKWFDSSETEVIQIHGHRNEYEYKADAFKKSFNLNTSVEFGAPLRIMTISKNRLEFFEIKNNVFNQGINPWKRDEK